jgi:hypothetical protein
LPTTRITGLAAHVSLSHDETAFGSAEPFKRKHDGVLPANCRHCMGRYHLQIAHMTLIEFTLTEQAGMIPESNASLTI